MVFMIDYIFMSNCVNIAWRIWPWVHLGSDTKNDIVSHDHIALSSEGCYVGDSK
jgi:hypothetical protein